MIGNGPARGRAMLEPELLGGPVPFHGGAVQGRDDIEAEGVPDALQLGGELGVVFERVPKRGERDFEFAARAVGAGPFDHQFEEFALKGGGHPRGGTRDVFGFGMFMAWTRLGRETCGRGRWLGQETGHNFGFAVS